MLHICTELGLDNRQDVRVTGVQDGQDTDSEQLTTGSAQLVVAALEVVDRSLGQHGVVLQLGLSQDRGVGGDDDHLSLVLSDRLDGRLVAKGVLTGLDGQGQLGVHKVGILLALWGLNNTRGCTKRSGASHYTVSIRLSYSAQRKRHPPQHARGTQWRNEDASRPRSSVAGGENKRYTDHLCVLIYFTPVSGCQESPSKMPLHTLTPPLPASCLAPLLLLYSSRPALAENFSPRPPETRRGSIARGNRREVRGV